VTIQRIRPEQWQTQRWQNGGGITHQIIRKDDEYGMLWRLSVAEVTSDGPFSLFEGIDRSIMLLSGDGFRLQGQTGVLCELPEPLQPFYFAGETEINCSLLGGPVRDFNLMLRRDTYASVLSVLEIAPHAALSVLGQTSLLYIAAGDVAVVFNRHLYRLHAGDTLLLHNESGVLHLDSINDAKAVFINLTAKSKA